MLDLVALLLAFTVTPSKLIAALSKNALPALQLSKILAFESSLCKETIGSKIQVSLIHVASG